MEAIVEYNYVAQEPDELTIRKGDVIKEIKVMVGGWWEGTLRDKRGMFPDNFVKVVEPSSSASVAESGTMKSDEVTLRNGSGRKWCKVLFSYEPCNDDELALVPQDSVEFLGEVEEGWWTGRLRGRVGVFPSNFVSPPVSEESEKHKDKDKKEYCRVLFPYEAANEDELTLVEGEIITLVSRDAPDKGWWKGELRGQVGLFPDNFVEIISMKNDSQEQEQWYDVHSQHSSVKSTAKHLHQTKKAEKANVRRSLDMRNMHSEIYANVETTKKTIPPSSPSPLASSSPMTCLGGSSGEKKNSSNHSLISLENRLKRLVGDSGNNNGNNGNNVALGEELDGVERGEGAPLSHLTASRAKAPRRRRPSSQHLRHAAGSAALTNTGSFINTASTILEDNLANGSADSTLDLRDGDEVEGLAAKARRKAPWVQELKMNQMERKKMGSMSIDKPDKPEKPEKPEKFEKPEKPDKPEIRKEKAYANKLITPKVGVTIPLELENDDKQTDNERSPKAELHLLSEHTDANASGTTPAFVPYHLYSQLLERVAALEEKQVIMEQTIGQLSEQLIPFLGNASINNKV